MDPWHWDVDEVVYNLCNDGALWSGRPNASVPPDLGEKIKEVDIDGPVLLQDLDDGFLKEELGIRSARQRSTIRYGIEKLRQRSKGYKLAQQTKAEADTLNPSSTPPPIEESTSTYFSTSPAPRDGEVLVDDGHGARKRRKLVLGSPVAPIEGSSQRTIRTSGLGYSNRLSGYLGKAPLKLDSMFYGNLSTGDEIDPKDDIDLPEDFANDDDLIEGAGLKIVFARRMRYFLRSEPIQVESSKLAVLPYPERLATKERAATLVTSGPTDRTVKITRSSAAAIKTASPGGGEWEFLLKKYPPSDNKDDTVRVWNGPEAEEYPQSLIDEMETEKAEQERRANGKRSNIHLTAEEIGQAVDDTIQGYEQDWEQQKKPRWEGNAWKVWLKGRNGSLLIDNTRLQLSNLDLRISKIRKAICDEVWTNITQVAKQCNSLKESVIEKKVCLWKLALWRSNKPPSKSILQKSALAPVRKASPGFVDSDSEELDSDDGLADFVVDDDEGQERPVTGPIRALSPLSNSAATVAVDDKQLTSSTDLEDDDASTSRRSSVDSVLVPNARGRNIRIPDDIEVVDLTTFSIPDTSPQNSAPHEPESPFNYDSDMFDDDPEGASLAEIESWEMRTLEEHADRKRIIIKLLLGLKRSSPQIYIKLKNHVISSPPSHLPHDFEVGLTAIAKSSQEISGTDPNTAKMVLTLSRFFICWTHANVAFNDDEAKISELLMEDAQYGIDHDLDVFLNFLRAMLANAAWETDMLDDEEESEDALTPHRKKRKFEFKQSRIGIELREIAKTRREQGEIRKAKLLASGQGEDFGFDDLGSSTIVNTSKADEDGFIYLNRHIAKRVKPHQIEGIRFLWRELVDVGQSVLQGCLLAHAMGLGKTMQTISVLLTIAEASKNKRLSKQIPEPLRKSQTLILCPPGLVGNWGDELRSWLPKNCENIIGEIYDLSNHSPRLRPAVIEAWNENGGILIIGYETFRNLITNKSSASKPLNPEDYESLKKQLLDGPSIVVADEAHKMKNPKSGVGIAASQFKTTSRIALTGSPLANNLSEYYSMINWVAPGYLGDAQEFRAYYQIPIEEGSWADSTRYQQRQSLKKLQALKRDIDPIVSRADISVLKGTLKPKIEFVITLEMTPIQERQYRSMLRPAGQDAVLDTEDVSNTRLFAMLSVLGSLCGHPAVLLARLQAQASSKKKPSTKNALGNTDIEADAQIEIPRDLVERQKELFPTQHIEDPRLSPKIEIIAAILRHSKAVGDQVLIFSHQLFILDYLERCLQSWHISYNRLDGKTKMESRLAMAKDFNKGRWEVLLISTTAGGQGLNIPGGNRVIIVDFHFNPVYEEQAVGRSYRLGQKKPVYVYHIIMGGTFEVVLHQRRIFKSQLASRVVDRKNPARTAIKTGDMMFEPKPVVQQDIDEYRGKDYVLDRILASPEGQLLRTLSTTEVLHAETNEELTAEELKEVDAMVEDDKLRRTNHGQWLKRSETRINSAIELEQRMLIGQSYSNQYGHLPTQRPQWIPSLPFAQGYSTPGFPSLNSILPNYTFPHVERNRAPLDQIGRSCSLPRLEPNGVAPNAPPVPNASAMPNRSAVPDANAVPNRQATPNASAVADYATRTRWDAEWRLDRPLFQNG